LRPDERDRFEGELESQGVVRNFEMQIRGAAGNTIWCEKTARAVHDAAGKVVHYEGVLVDIDSRKRAEEEAGSARERLRELELETRQRERVDQVFGQLDQVEVDLLELDPARREFRKIKYVVDDRQQQLAARSNRFRLAALLVS
jgi:hypothetical protein